MTTPPYTRPTAADLQTIRDRVDQLADDRQAWGHATPADVDHLRRTVHQLIDMHLALAAEADRRINDVRGFVPPWVQHAARVRIEAVDGTALDVDGDEFRDCWHSGTVNEALAEAGGWPDLNPPATA